MNHLFSIFKRYENLTVVLSEKKDGSMRLGDKKATENRERFLEKIGIEPDSLISARLVHGKLVKFVSRKDRGKVIPGVDGLITIEKDIFLSITVADCLPIFLYDFGKEIVGLMHGGWRNLAQGILFSALEKFQELGSESQNILAGIGPGICQKHFEVKEDVFSFFKSFPSAISFEKEKIFLDLKKIAEIQLLNLGLRKENIEINSDCPFCLFNIYFSFRRDKSKTPQTMMAIFGQKST